MILSLGEILMRLSTTGDEKLEQASGFSVVYGGSEANVLIGLSLLGRQGRFLTKLPDNPFGIAARNHLRSFGPDTSFIPFGGERIGVYYLEHGSSLRSGKIVYDRNNASVNMLTPEEIDWASLFEGVSWFHWSGITPALSKNAATLCIKGIEEAGRRKIPVSCDLHYRANLWNYGQTPTEIIPDMLRGTQYLCGDPYTIRQMTDATASLPGGFLSDNQIYESFDAVLKAFPSLKSVSMLSREILSASANNLKGILYNGNGFASEVYRISPITDRIGGGDAFMTGIIDGLLSSLSPQEVIERATALSAYKHTIPGDQLAGSKSDIETFLNTSERGKISR